MAQTKMLKSLSLVLLLILSSSICTAQITNLNFAAPPPSAVQGNSITAQITGTRGSQQYYYWVVANYPIGSAFPGGPVFIQDVPDTLNGVNFVIVRWRGVTGATSYDLLRTTTPAFPSGACNCAVAVAIAVTFQVDISNVVVAYTVASQGLATGILRLDNQNFAIPTFVMNPGLDITGNLAVSGTITFGAFTQGSVLFVGPTGTIIEDNPEFFFNNAFDFLGIGTNNPAFEIHADDATSGAVAIHFTNVTTGSTATDGMTIGVATDESGMIGQNENLPINWFTNGLVTPDMTLDANGDFGVGDQTPDTRLEVLDTTSPQLRLTHTDGVDDVDFSIDANGDFDIQISGDNFVIQNDVDGVTGFQILDADGGVPIVNVDTTNERVGIGIPAPLYILDVRETSTAAAGDFATYSNITLSPGVASTAIARGFHGVATGTTAGVNFTDPTALRGVQGDATFSGPGTLAGAAGVMGIVQEGGTGTITNAYSLFAFNPLNSITNKFGVYIETITGGTTLNYAIYSAGGVNYFAGNVGIGNLNTAPTGTLDVLDRTAVTGASLLQLGTDGTNPSVVTTQLVIWDGSTQGTIPLIRLFDNAGGNEVGIDRNGDGIVEINDGVAGTPVGDLAFERWFATAILFAALGTPANGTFVYCSDCTIANPCAAVGTGALAKRLNGAWVCN